MNKAIVFLAIAAMSVSCATGVMKSPDKSVNARLVEEDGKLFYEVSFRGNTVIEKSRLGFVIDGKTVGEGVTVKLSEVKKIDEQYQTRGFHNIAVNKAVEYTYDIKGPELSFQWQARLYDDGFAFRYLFNEDHPLHIDKELTTFTPPHQTPVWFFERDSNYKLKTYAGEWIRTVSDSLNCISSQGPIQGGLMTFELPDDRYMLLTEAALYDYSGMRLECMADGSMVTNFTEGDKGFDIKGDGKTPWRAMILADDLNELVNSDLPTNLNPAPDPGLFADMSYIKPGRSVWTIWSSYRRPEYLTIPYERHFIDIAQELGYEYTIIDDPWEDRWPDKWQTLKELCEYAAERNVRVIVWKRCNGINIPDNDYEAIDHYLDSVKMSGAAGVKVDYMDSEAKQLIEFEEAVMRKTAEHKLMIDFHGIQSATGEFRTYPNEITREGIRGLELNTMNQPIPSNHNVALIFTRCVLNNSDYTPIGFSNPGNTTWTHQLATAYAFTSPLTVIAEHADTLVSNPILKKVRPFLEALPTQWDETQILPGSSIADRALMARRYGDDWYIVILNGREGKQVSVKTDFLKEGKWLLSEVNDDPADSADKNMIVSDKTISAGDEIAVTLKANGGYLAKLTKE